MNKSDAILSVQNKRKRRRTKVAPAVHAIPRSTIKYMMDDYCAAGMSMRGAAIIVSKQVNKTPNAVRKLYSKIKDKDEVELGKVHGNRLLTLEQEVTLASLLAKKPMGRETFTYDEVRQTIRILLENPNVSVTNTFIQEFVRRYDHILHT